MKKAISLCQSCRNRLWQIKETLSPNLNSISNDCEIVLVDYGSTDDLANWVWNNFRSFIEGGALVFFEVRNRVFWSAPRAKNLAHRLSNGKYLFNLDADNFILDSDLKMIREASSLDLACHQFSGDLRDGSFGRIGLPRNLFFDIGGYDESLLPMGAQDMDLLKRLAALGKKIEILNATSKSPITNNFLQKMVGVLQDLTDEDMAKQSWGKMEAINQIISNARLITEGPIRLGGFHTFQGLLNGEMIIIDGLNRIQRMFVQG